MAPVYTGLTAREIPVNGESSSPPQTETPVHLVRDATLAEVNGPGTYFWLTIPVAVAVLPLLVRSRAVRLAGRFSEDVRQAEGAFIPPIISFYRNPYRRMIAAFLPVHVA